jgi:hypothetical protein
VAEQPRYGRAVIGEVIPLPELAFDLSEGRSLEGLGRGDAPVHILPEVAFDLSEPEGAPALELCLYLRPGKTSGEVALDLFRLYAAVNELELSHHGGGLRPTSGGDFTESERRLRVTFIPTAPEGARERLQKIVAVINTPVSEPPRYPAIERYEARVA